MNVPKVNEVRTTKTGGPAGFDSAVNTALQLASRAPSIHNTQPWRWELRGDTLALLADRSRQLAVSDPDGHSLLISCGAALSLMELGLRAAGWNVEITRTPDSTDSDLLAYLRAAGHAETPPLVLDRADAALRRRSERRPFGPGRLSEREIDQLTSAAGSQGVFAHFPRREQENLELAVVVSGADRYERNDPDYLAEMAHWLRSGEPSSDGVPLAVVPEVTAGSPRHTDVPLRDFEIGIPGAQLIESGIDEKPQLAVLFTDGDSSEDRLIAGEAMARLMVESELLNLSSCPLSQAVDMVTFRARLQTLMSWTEHPQMMLRLGRPPTSPPAPLTRRRPIADIFKVV